MSPDTALLGSYFAILALLGLYGAHRLALLARFRWLDRAGEADRADDDRAAAAWPFVTVQLPIFNERTVAARLIESVGALDYPRERFEIQVLDDSDDETTAIAERAVVALRARGVEARVLRRTDRTGFKAGALDWGMQRARGELLCIFDADFLPDRDFLRRIVPHFDDPSVGMAQARWGHVNREQSALTRAQATLLDGHFVIEHKVRYDRGLFFNFNGTAGVWRRRAIEDAGGWQHDTLTEDLDLSYRAQLAGWRFVYAPALVAPAEVPPTIGAFKSQQHRWAKGSVQVARKLGPRLISADLPWRVRLEALAHLSGNSGCPLVLALAVLLPLAMQVRLPAANLVHVSLFTLCTLSVVLFYECSQRALGRSPLQRLRDIPAAVALGIGMSVSQTHAVLEGLRRDPGVFVRTPKDGDAPRARRYAAALGGLAGAELLLALWFAWAVAVAVRQGLWGSLPFLLLFLWGFTWVGGLSVRERLRTRQVLDVSAAT